MAVKVAVVVEAVVDRGMGSGELLQSLLEFSKNNFKKYIKSPLVSYIHQDTRAFSGVPPGTPPRRNIA